MSSSRDHETLPAGLRLAAVPHVAHVGDRVDLTMRGPGHGHAVRGVTATLLERRGTGWRAVYLLGTIGTPQAGNVRYPLAKRRSLRTASGLAPKSRDLVQIPAVAPGRYRVRVAVGIPGGQRGALSASLRIAG